MRTLALPPRRAGHAPDASVLERREGSSTRPGAYREHPDVEIKERRLGDVRCLCLTPPGHPPGTLVFAHGGAYRAGSPERLTGFTSQLAARSGWRIISPTYGLAPEFPFPAAIHDSAAVIEALFAETPDETIVLGGESAGAGLAATLAARFGTHVPAPRLAGAMLLSPWVDMRVSAGAYTSRAGTDQLFSLERASDAAELYLQGVDPRDPLASPVFADLSGMPPTQIIVGGAEVLLDDSLLLAGEIARHGVTVELHAIADMQHVSPTLFPDLACSIESFALMEGFLRRILTNG